MELKLVRNKFSDNSTMGILSIVDSDLWWHTLEDVDRALNQNMPIEELLNFKIRGLTAIPYGRYQVVIDVSTRFKKLMPHILFVPGFDGVRIHAGNTSEDTSGCLLIGRVAGFDFVGESQKAMNEFYPILHTALEREKCFIEIIKNPELTKREMV